MPTSLQGLFQTIAQARDERELRSRVMDAVGDYFQAQCWSLCLVDERRQSAAVDTHGIADVDAFVARYGNVDRAADPVMRYMAENHAPTHEELLLSAESWKQSNLYQEFCAHYGHEHILAGPIVGEGRLIGGVYLARAADAPGFDAKDLAGLGAICTHLSARLAGLRSQAQTFNPALIERLTPREREIAELVARGLTNGEIGTELWIAKNSVKQALKRMFRKLEVSSRAQMVARLKETAAVSQ